MKKKSYFVILFFLAVFLINLVSAVDLNSGTIYSTGLNATINITYPFTVDLLSVSNTSITFYNLTYCGSLQYGVYNYTTSNVSATIDQIFVVNGSIPGISSCTITSSSTTSSSSQDQSQTVLPSTPTPATSQQYSWSLTLNPQSASVLNFDKPSLSLSEMDISVNQAQNENIIVTQYDGIPPGIHSVNSQIYQYLSINFNPPLISGSANLIFKVNKSWVSNNNLNFDNITVYKLDNLTNNQWIVLPTTYKGSDNNSYYYQTTVNSFSYFAIGGVSVTQQTNLGNSPNSVPPSYTWIWITTAVIIILIVGILIIRKNYHNFATRYGLRHGPKTVKEIIEELRRGK